MYLVSDKIYGAFCFSLSNVAAVCVIYYCLSWSDVNLYIGLECSYMWHSSSCVIDMETNNSCCMFESVKYFNKMGKQHIPQQLSCLICIY